MVLLNPFSHNSAYLYSAYVGLLRGAVAVAITLSLLVSIDRIYKVCARKVGWRVAGLPSVRRITRIIRDAGSAG